MKCSVCGNAMVVKKGEIDLRIQGKLYLVRNVSYQECAFCGEKVLSPKVSEVLYKKIQNREFVEQDIRIPILDGAYA